MVHPHPGDVVPVGLELAGPVADDGGVGAVGPDAAEVAQQILPDRRRVAEQQSQTCPATGSPPAPAAPAVVVVVGQGSCSRRSGRSTGWMLTQRSQAEKSLSPVSTRQVD